MVQRLLSHSNITSTYSNNCSFKTRYSSNETLHRICDSTDVSKKSFHHFTSYDTPFYRKNLSTLPKLIILMNF